MLVSASHGRHFQSSPSIDSNDFASIQFASSVIQFNSGTDAVSVKEVFDTQLTNATGNQPKAFSFWVKKTEEVGCAIFHARGSYSPEQPDIYISTLASGKVAFQLSSGTSKYVGVSAGKLEKGKWHHVIITYDGSAGTLYRDGDINTLIGVTAAGVEFTNTDTEGSGASGGAFAIYIDGSRQNQYDFQRSVGGGGSDLFIGLHALTSSAEIFVGNDHFTGGGVEKPSGYVDGGALSGSIADFNWWGGKKFGTSDASLIYNASIFGARKLSSGIPNLPTKVELQLEESLEDYPTIIRSGDKNRFGNEGVSFDDTLTIIATNSVHGVDDGDSNNRNYPTGLPENYKGINDPNLNDVYASPHVASTLSLPFSGSSYSGIYNNYGKNKIRKSSVNFSPFDDTKALPNNDNLDGLSEDIYPGFSARYSSKVRIEIDLTSATTSTVGLSTDADFNDVSYITDTQVVYHRDNTTGPKQTTCMGYWNPNTRKWDQVGSPISFPFNFLDHENAGGFDDILTNQTMLRKFCEEAAIGFSPNEGFTLAVTSSLSGSISDSFNMACRPTDTFGFPIDGRYHAGPTEGDKAGRGGAINMSKYINKPFLLEKVEWDLDVSAAINHSSSMMHIEDKAIVSSSFNYEENSTGIHNLEEGIYFRESPF
ncbi:MAG: hypothetical protein CMA12_07770, partial [Euryarchaeota archaeon]|nr:hypothetical protein [Euryarchaeota archaeon]